MDVEATSRAPLETGADTIVVGVFDDEPFGGELPIAPLLESGEARGELAALALTHVDERRVLVVGLGRRERFGPERMRVAAAAALGRARELRAQRLCWSLPAEGEEVAAAMVEGMLLRAYRFERYKPRARATGPEALIVSSPDNVAGAVQRAATIAKAQNRARDLGNTPPNELTPAALADYAYELAERRPALSVRVMDEAEIRAAGMGAFAAVAQGSAAEARLIELDYAPDGAEGPPGLTMIGKGLTFDSGGLSLKPLASLIPMKFDMCGGAAVIEAIAALAELGAPVSVRGIVGATENMPSGTAVKPGDIVRALTARRSRSTTPMPRAGWFWPTASATRVSRDASGSSTWPR